ncbi:MAG: NAD(P)/FAD-dependent oxidoreductase [Clostridia bacterium]
MTKNQSDRETDVLIIGAGASGLMAAAAVAREGKKCLVVDRMPRAGSKILVTGKGRCNITNHCEIETVIRNTPGNGSFLYSALHGFSPSDIMEYFESRSVPLKTERGGRVFPVSDKASDVRDALLVDALAQGVSFAYNTRICGLLEKDGVIMGAFSRDREFPAKKVILACGGASYPQTGSDGSGYGLAKHCGHTVIPPRGALTGLETREKWPYGLSGLTLKNIRFSLHEKDKTLFTEAGELLFTHFGISGPVVLTASRFLPGFGKGVVRGRIDMKPALDFEKLDARVRRDFLEYDMKQFKNSLDMLLPKVMIPVAVNLSGIHPEKQVNQITKEERQGLVRLMKSLELEIMGPRPIGEAIVTTGGISVTEVHPGSMESKLVKGLYFCGEILDVDALTGGFNLTIAFSTGHLAGKKAAEALE